MSHDRGVRPRDDRRRGTYEDPCRFPAGVRAVIVNGTAVARDGRHTGTCPGRAFRRAGPGDLG